MNQELGMIERSIRKVYFIVLAFLMLFIFNVSFVAAQNTATGSAVATESAGITYQLAYPGILPDHPLYFLKAARDKIISFFISDPIEKADYDLLQSDKRIGASKNLLEKGKTDLAQSTFSKAENYFEQALSQADSAKRQGIQTDEIVKKLQEANLKHQQVLSDMLKELNQENNNVFDVELERLVGFEKKVKALLPE
jgi:hypothetical protein